MKRSELVAGDKGLRNLKGVVYMATFPNGKRYIGITTQSLITRVREHERRPKGKGNLANAISTFGKENIDWKILFSSKSLFKLKRAERILIKKYRTISKGYNKSIGGQGSAGVRHPKSFGIKQSILKRTYFSKPENRLKLSNATRLAYKENPLQAKKHSKHMRTLFKSQSRRRMTAEKQKAYLSNPENLLKHAVARGARSFTVIQKGVPFREYLSQNQCARELGLNVSKVNACLHGTRKTHKGFTFAFK